MFRENGYTKSCGNMLDTRPRSIDLLHRSGSENGAAKKAS
jgi:hypothetical protein